MFALFFVAPPLSLSPLVLFGISLGRSSFCWPWRRLAGLASSTRCLLWSPFLSVISCPSFLSFGLSRSPRLALFLVPYESVLFPTLLATFLTNSFSVRLCVCISTVLSPFLLVLVLSLCLLALLLVLVLCLKTLSASFFGVSLRILILPLAFLFLWFHRRLPLPRSSLCAHGVRGVAASWAFHRNTPLSFVLEAATWSSASVFTSISLTFNFLPLRVSVWVWWWLRVLWYNSFVSI